MAVQANPWWVIGFFAAEPESIGEDINGEPPTGTQIMQGTQAQANAAALLAVNGKAFGPYNSKALAQAAINAGGLKGDKSPAGNALSSLGSGFSLDLGPWLLRIGEIVLGLVLIGVGVAKLTGVENTLSKLPKVIPV